MSETSNNSGGTPRSLLALALALEAETARQPFAQTLDGSARRPERPRSPAPAGPLARALAEARGAAQARTASVAPTAHRSAAARPCGPAEAGLQAPVAFRQPAGTRRLPAFPVAAGALLGCAAAAVVAIVPVEHRDLGLGALLCILLGAAAFAGERMGSSPRRSPAAGEPPAAPLPAAPAGPGPAPPTLDDLRSSLSAIRRAMAEAGESSTAAST